MILKTLLSYTEKTYEKNVLLTGATGGIGEAICSKLSKLQFIVVSRNQEKLKTL